MAFCNPVKCIQPSDTSIVINRKRSNTLTKTLFHRQLFKKSSSRIQSQSPMHSSVKNHLQSNARFQRIKGSNFVREVNPNSEYSIKTDSTNNYDMTILHDDQLDDTTYSAVSRRRSKKIPRWARKSQLQLAFINQIYFNNKNPEDIFGSIQINAAHEMVQSIEIYNTEFSLNYSFSMLPPNFV
ncbi:unnamed protein product [Rotaria sp. Silwood1]|nr:unnamed protein product [Rotaria sp. Silwood1]CAF0772085.1 unnamed protein product [Rotaria sp. Silwood1]CAF3339699.1 unnamed protein product [Rotaria sp. Silwood1]CAF3347828.1 unnamed protein product [Rotaria sp. Silwood1]CAF4748781.1 unnamed protein product [Rotaria sp. Silwood1]